MNSELRTERELRKKSRTCLSRLPLWCALLAVVGSSQAQQSPGSEEPLLYGPSTIHYSTPPGVTLVEVVTEGGYSSSFGSGYQWTRLGDAEGRTLFTWDGDGRSGVSRCTGDCAREFPPLLAPPGAGTGGDWSLVPRDNGSRQWAYKGKPLYRFAKETRPNQVVDSVLAAGMPEDHLAPMRGKDHLLPPPGWHIAKFSYTGPRGPNSIGLRELAMASGLALVDHQGMTLYTFVGNAPAAPQCASDCRDRWLPLPVAEMSGTVGLFTTVRFDGGSRQWAFRGAPLFRYSGDARPGDIRGVGEQWRIATLVRHFMPANVRVSSEPVHGNILSRADGMPLYSRNPYTRSRPRERLYRRGRLLGTQFCDAKCLQTWRPLVAPADARPRGYWEIFEREDGTRQWAYKGFAQYVNINDKPHSVASGDNTYEYVVGDKGRYKVSEVITPITNTIYPAGLFWEVTLP